MMKALPFFCAIWLLVSGLPLHAQERCTSAADRAVVMLDVAGSQYGAGVVIGIQGDNIFIVTARHVVEGENGAEIKATFNGDRQNVYQATISNISANKDVAFLIVRDGSLADVMKRTIVWQSLPGKSSATESQYVSIIGNSGGEGWTKSEILERVIARASNGIKVESHSTRPGTSGGGVFDPSEELVGIVSTDNGQVAAVVPIEGALQDAKGFGISVGLTENRAATPAVYVAALKGAPGNWGDDVATLVRQKLGRVRRVIECENEKAISMKGSVEFRSPTLTTDVAAITWQFSGRKNTPATASTQYLVVNRLPWKHAVSDPDLLTDQTDEAADFAVTGVTNYLNR
jgi:hypothetical protein